MQIGGLAAVIAPERSRDAIFDALRGYSSYATRRASASCSTPRSTARGWARARTPPPSRRIEVQTSGTAAIDQIDVVRNGEVVFTRHYLDAPLERGGSWLQVGFESPSDVFDARPENPRAWRWWQGTVEVTGARLAELRTTGLDNPLEDWAREDPEHPGTIQFHIGTRGRRDTILLRLEGAGPDTALRFRLDPTERVGLPRRHGPARGRHPRSRRHAQPSANSSTAGSSTTSRSTSIPTRSRSRWSICRARSIRRFEYTDIAAGERRG